MTKNLLATLLLAMSVSALAETAPAVQYSRDANYVYIKQPLRVTLDQEQQAALQNGVRLIQKQLTKFNQTANQVDPDGDLKALSDSANQFSQNVSQLINVSSQLYGEVKPYGAHLFEALPTAVVVFGGAEYDKNVLRFVQGGGSVMIGAVLVPMAVERVSVKNPNDVVHYVTWDSSLILMPTVNVGPGVSVTGGGSNVRAGVGLVWGELNNPKELNGLTGGASMTLDVGAGVNVRVLGLKNMNKPGAINNYMLLVGLDRGQMSATNSKLPLLEMNAESHLNLSWIYDAQATISGITNFGKDMAQRIAPHKP